MDFNNLALFQVMKAKMGYLSQRQAVLAQNIANADTPNYRAQDIEQPDFRKVLGGMSPAQKLQTGQLRMAHTNTGHMSMGNVAMQFNTIERRNTYELNPNGNNVTIEEEMMKVAENQQEYQKVTSVYAKTVELFKTAIGRPGGG